MGRQWLSFSGGAARESFDAVHGSLMYCRVHTEILWGSGSFEAFASPVIRNETSALQAHSKPFEVMLSLSPSGHTVRQVARDPKATS
jgi:hypothetical protein